MTELTITQHRFPSHATTVATLENALDETGRLELSDVGAGSVTLPLDDTNDIRINDLLRFVIDGTRRHAFIGERIEEHTLDERGGAAEYRRITGRGVGALPEWGIIGPANGFGALPKESTRLFNVYSVEYDISALPNAVETGMTRIPAEWPDGTLGPYITGPSGTATLAPAGPTYLFDDFTLDDDVEATLFLSADNWATGHVDGQKQLTAGGQSQGNSYLRTYTTRVLLSAGTHRVAVRLFNKGSDNPSGIRWLLAETDDAGEVTNVLHQSDDTWKALETPATQPGMTPGQAVLIALESIQARGGLTWLSTDFDEDDDSDGATWPIVADISTKTGNDLLTFLIELSATYIDWVIDPDTLTLSLRVKGTMGGASGVALTPAPVTDPRTGNLLQLDRVFT